MKRINNAITFEVEERILNYLVVKVPLWITPDMLTFIAIASAFVSAVMYVYAQDLRILLLAINICLFIHWLADSLDGRVARFRKVGRENYGYYIDHIMDSFSAALFLGGLTTSALTETTAWVWVLSLMLLTMVHTFLKTKVFGAFQMSIKHVGPTEARLGLMFVNVIIFLFGNPRFIIRSIPFRLIDIIGWITVVMFLIVLIPDIINTAIKLNEKDRKYLSK